MFGADEALDRVSAMLRTESLKNSDKSESESANVLVFADPREVLVSISAFPKTGPLIRINASSEQISKLKQQNLMLRFRTFQFFRHI